MSSLAISLGGLCTPTKKPLNPTSTATVSSPPTPTAAPSCLPTKNLERIGPSSAKLKIPRSAGTHPLPNDDEGHLSSLALSRRQKLGMIGAAVLLGLADDGVFHLFKPHIAAAAAVASYEFTVAPSGLAFCDQVLGTGPQATKGQLIKAHYVGKLENGKVFDSSYSRGKPLTFRVGVGEVIKGWDQGILGDQGVPPMRAGGKRTLKLPPYLGYGARGAGCRGGSCIIPPDSVLLFEVEFIG